MVRALRFIQNSTPDQIVAAVPPEYYGDKALYKAALVKNLEGFRHDGIIGMDAAQDVYRDLKTFDPGVQNATHRPVEDDQHAVRAKGRAEVQVMAGRPVVAAAVATPVAAAGAVDARMAATIAALEFDHVTCAFAARGAVPGAAAGRYVAVESASLDVAPASSCRSSGPPAAASPRCSTSPPACSRPSAGELRVFGVPLSGINRDAGYLFQAEALMPWRSALDNVTAGLEFRGVPKAEAEPRARDWLARVGLSGFEDRYPHQLSGGMRKRVALAQMLILDPKILLMDEPFSALDVQTRQLMENELLDLWSADRKSVLFITHDLEEAISLSDRVVVLSAGPATRPIGEFVIDLPRPRDVSEIRMTPRFVELHQAIWHAMKDEVLKGYARGRREGASEREAANG